MGNRLFYGEAERSSWKEAEMPDNKSFLATFFAGHPELFSALTLAELDALWTNRYVGKDPKNVRLKQVANVLQVPNEMRQNALQLKALCREATIRIRRKVHLDQKGIQVGCRVRRPGSSSVFEVKSISSDYRLILIGESTVQNPLGFVIIEKNWSAGF